MICAIKRTDLTDSWVYTLYNVCVQGKLTEYIFSILTMYTVHCTLYNIHCTLYMCWYLAVIEQYNVTPYTICTVCKSIKNNVVYLHCESNTLFCVV